MTETVIRSAAGQQWDYLGYYWTVSADGSTIASSMETQNKVLVSRYPFTTITEFTPTGMRSGYSTALALSSDGSVLAIGQTMGYASFYGRVWVRYGTNWGSEIYGTGASGDALGFSVAITPDGSVVAATAATAGTNAKGALHVWSGTNWGTHNVIIPALSGTLGTTWGDSIAITPDGSKIVVGTARQNVYRGTISVYSGYGWTTETYCSPQTSYAYDYRGLRVAISDDGTVVASAAPNASPETGTDGTYNGKAWVWSGTNYATKTTLVASNRAANQYFGSNMWMSPTGNIICCSARGTAVAGEIHAFSGSSWGTETIIAPGGSYFACMVVGTGGGHMVTDPGIRGVLTGVGDGSANEDWVIIAGSRGTTTRGIYLCYGTDWASSTFVAPTLGTLNSYGDMAADGVHPDGPQYRVFTTDYSNADGGSADRGLMFAYTDITGPPFAGYISLDAQIATWSAWSETWSNLVGTASQTGDFTLDAEFAANTQFAKLINAILRKTMDGTPFTVDAHVTGVVSRSFTLDAVIKARQLHGTDWTEQITRYGFPGSQSGNLLITSSVDYATLLAAPDGGYSGLGGNQANYGIGQRRTTNPLWWNYESWFAWPVIPHLAVGMVVDAVSLRFYGNGDNSDTDFTIEAYQFDWMEIDPTEGNYWLIYLDNEEIQGLYAGSKLMATYDTAGGLSGWAAFTDVGLAGLLTQGYRLELLLASSRFRTSSEPATSSTNEYVFLRDNWGGINNTEPRLWITYHANTGFTIDANITGAVQRSFTVNAVIDKVFTPDFTLDAWVNYPLRAGDFTLDAVVLETLNPTFTLDAWVAGIATGVFYLDAITLAVQSPDFTLDAILLRVGEDSFTLDATLFKTTTLGFTLDAWVNNGNEYTFPLNAWLAGAITLDAQIVQEIFSDTFTRTVADGLGTSTGIHPVPYYPSPYEWNDPSSSSVDGDSWVIASGNTYSYFTGPPGALETLIVFDFWVPADLTDGTGSNWPAYIVGPGPFPGDYREYAWIGSNGDGTWWVGTMWGGDDFTPTPSTMYRAKLYLKNASGGYGRSKAWKVSDPEPEAWLSSWEITSHPTTGDILTEVGIESPEAEAGYLDNLRIYWFGGQIHWVSAFTIDAWVSPTKYDNFTIDAWIGRWRTIDAVVVAPISNRFLVGAYLIAPRVFTLDAILEPGGLFTLDAWVWMVVTPEEETGSFTLQAEIYDGPVFHDFIRLDAFVLAHIYGSFTVAAVLARLVTTRTGSAPVDALILDYMAGSFGVDALIDDGHRSGGFAVDADILGALEQRGSFTVAASLRREGGGRFLIDALLEAREVFRIDAWLAGAFTLDALLVGPKASSFTLDARLVGGISLDALIVGPRESGLTLDAVVADENGAFPDHEVPFVLDALIVASMTGQPPIWLNAIIRGLSGGSFTLDALIQPSFTINAWLSWPDGGLYGGLFSIDAYIRGNDTILWPEDGGPATDTDGEPIPDWFKASRKYRVNITLDGTDVTGDVIWAQTNFTQNAKTNPGTFELTLRGVFGFDGGEVILVTLDDFRVFGGYVLTVEKGYAFSADAGDPITTLRGSDFNVLFDKMIVYNKASVDDPQGSYTIWKSFKKNTSDITIIHKVLSSYVDLPAGFDYTTFVDEVGNAAPEKPWTMPTAGSPLRQVMQSLSQVTNAVWWIDPYLYLHYGDRTTVNAPYPITDGLGGISSQNISMSEDMSMLVTETILWGTLSYTVEGEIMAMKKVAESYPSFGPWQHGEFRTDLHHEAFIDRRTDSIIERYGQPIRRAKVTIFDPGYQAGQVADVRLTQHGLEAPLVIRSLVLTFAVAKEPTVDFYHAVPRYELTIGLDPEEPWDIYDYLPWPDDEGTDYPPRRGRTKETTAFEDEWSQSYGEGRSIIALGGTFAEIELHNMENDGLAVIWGPHYETWHWAYGYTNGVIKSPLGDGYTYDASSRWSVGDSVAGYATRCCTGAMTHDGIYYNAVTVAGWTADYGPWPPQPFHESHTGGPTTILPVGDIEWRQVYRAERNAQTPQNIYSSTLFGYGPPTYGFTGTTPYDLGFMVTNMYIDGDPYGHDGSAGIPFQMSLIETSETEGPPDFFGGATLVTGRQTASDNWVGHGTVSVGTPFPDLLFVCGEQGGLTDPVNLQQRYCPLTLFGTDHYGYMPYPRWPGDPVPIPVYMFCPYHIGATLFLDGRITGMVPVQASLNTNIGGAEVIYPVAPGWGWTGKYHWIPGSAADTNYNWDDTSHDYMLSSGVRWNEDSERYESFLRLPVPTVEIDAYDWNQASVFVDYFDDDQLTQSPFWSYEILCHFSVPEWQSHTFGDLEFGPALYMGMGYAQVEVYPGVNVFNTFNYYPDWYIDSPVDLFESFHVRMVGSDQGWGIKIWQHKDPVPEDWFAWYGWPNSHPERSVGQNPAFRFWTDRTRHGTSASPYSDVDISFVVEDFTITEGVSPLVFEGAVSSDPPTSISISEMLRKTDDPEGEVFGMVGDGWNFETVPVDADRKFETTARVTRGTVSVYNSSGVFLHPVDDWQYNGSDGQHFILTTATAMVTVFYRAWVLNVRSEYSVPRMPDPSGVRHRPIPEP